MKEGISDNFKCKSGQSSDASAGSVCAGAVGSQINPFLNVVLNHLVGDVQTGVGGARGR